MPCLLLLFRNIRHVERIRAILKAMFNGEQEPISQFLGVKDALTSPYGFNGGFYYLRLRADF